MAAEFILNALQVTIAPKEINRGEDEGSRRLNFTFECFDSWVLKTTLDAI